MESYLLTLVTSGSVITYIILSFKEMSHPKYLKCETCSTIKFKELHL
jgi:hypothetical protein